jgi:hypothetical protein
MWHPFNMKPNLLELELVWNVSRLPSCNRHLRIKPRNSHLNPINNIEVVKGGKAKKKLRRLE